jgi:hypothetical protein
MKRDPFTLPQSLILTPDHAFGTVRKTLVGLGFVETTTPDRRADDPPASAQFAHPSGLPSALYTRHGPTGLGMLHLATVPPRLRGRIAEALPWITPSRLVELFRSDDPRLQLYGLWAARQDERTELVHDIRTLAAGASGHVRKEAETIAEELSALARTQLETLAGMQLIAAAALPLIAEFRDGDVLRAHLPSEADCALLFEPQIASDVARALESHAWPRGGVEAQPAGVGDVFAGPAGLLRWPNPVSDRFPRGYRTIAGWMKPARIWLGWTGELASGGTLRFDGLVFAEGRWIFFPRPWRIVTPLLPTLETVSPDPSG